MSNKTPGIDLKVKGAFHHAQSCATESHMAMVIKLIHKDAEQHHLFFNDEKFHNHLVHQLLANYSLGADVLRLEKVYHDNAVNQRPARPIKADFSWDSLNCLGNEDYYTSYVNFFQEEIHKKGSKRCIEYYIFEQGSRLGFYSRFLSGIYHSLIHLGYGIEFNYPLMIAEGLAWVAVHRPRFHHFYEAFNKRNIESELLSQNDKKVTPCLTALDIISSIHLDSRINNVVQWADEDKYASVIHRVPDLLREYCQQWPVTETLDGPMGLRARAIELQVLASALYGSSYRPGKEIIFDFFLMHTLTSSLFLHCYIEHLDPCYAASLLRGKFASDMVYYIAHNRPDLNVEQFRSCPGLLTWEQIISKAIASEDEHVPKAVRALIHTSYYDKARIFSPDMYQAMASLTVDDHLSWNLDPM